MHLDESPRPHVDVLIADDDAQLRGSVRSLLEARGYTCAEAGDGVQAVQAAHALAPRCVLLDLGMPGLDGIAVARSLRGDPRTVGAHVHCLTGRTDPASRRRAEEAGCESFLAKPADPAAILQAVGGPAVPVGAGCRRGLTKAAAEELLDWLEAHGYPPADVSLDEQGGFTVRLAEPPVSEGGAGPTESARSPLGGRSHLPPPLSPPGSPCPTGAMAPGAHSGSGKAPVAEARFTPGRPAPAGPFSPEHRKALADLMQHGRAEAKSPEEEHALADLAAAGFATKQGNVFVWTGRATAPAEAGRADLDRAIERLGRPDGVWVSRNTLRIGIYLSAAVAGFAAGWVMIQPTGPPTPPAVELVRKVEKPVPPEMRFPAADPAEQRMQVFKANLRRGMRPAQVREFAGPVDKVEYYRPGDVVNDFDVRLLQGAMVARRMPFEVPGGVAPQYRVNLLFLFTGNGSEPLLDNWYFRSPN
jgi:CheY-like chemotaxis protein